MNSFKLKVTMKILIFFILTSIAFISCTNEAPTEKDGNFFYSAVVSDTSGILAVDSVLGYAPFKNRNITLESMSYYQSFNNRKKYYGKTDELGYIEFENLGYSDYLLYSEFIDTVKYDSVNGSWDSTKIGIVRYIQNIDKMTHKDSIFNTLAEPGLIINEIFYSSFGTVKNLFADQFIELFNSSDEVKYLDGMLICSLSRRFNPDLEKNDFVQALYVFQFPGTPITGTNYPINPQEFVVIAGDAIDHSSIIENSVNLSNAEWEFYNSLAGEHDNQAMNVSNILTDRTVDFILSAKNGAVILADGSDWYFGEQYPQDIKRFVNIPINTIIDGIEYSQNSGISKILTRRLDASLAGIGLIEYSGKSIERRIPGFDTNNSIVDFVILDSPTPGY